LSRAVSPAGAPQSAAAEELTPRRSAGSYTITEGRGDTEKSEWEKIRSKSQINCQKENWAVEEQHLSMKKPPDEGKKTIRLRIGSA